MEKFVRVLRQDWRISGASCPVTSISKDRAQLDQTIADVAPGGPLGKKKSAIPQGDTLEIRIDAGSPFADMVQEETVFLHNDEMDLIYDSPDAN